MNDPPRLNEWRITSRIGMNRNVNTIVDQMAMMILPNQSPWSSVGLRVVAVVIGSHVANRDSMGRPGGTSPGHPEHDDAPTSEHHEHAPIIITAIAEPSGQFWAHVELAVDHRPDHVARRAAEQRRRDEVAAHRDERQHDAGGNARPRQRQGHL